jgi:Clp amino terminal domain, pathogenicity island component
MTGSVQVGSLISQIAGSGPVERLQTLAQLRRDLDSLETELAADALRAGHTWREIGAALGVSKQAAHRRHSHGVALLDRAAETEHRGSRVIVSEEVRTAVRVARREAAAAGVQAFGTEHLLLGLLQCGDEPTVVVLDQVGVTLPVAREAIQPTLELSPTEAALARAVPVDVDGDGDEEAEPAAPSRTAVVSPLARRILSRSLAECSRRASESLSALDLLRALLKDRHGGAAQTLERLGVDPASVQAEIERIGTVAGLPRP